MTREECFKRIRQRREEAKSKLDEDYSYYIGIITGINQASEIFGMMQEPSLPSDVDEAAEKYYPKMSRLSEPHGVIPADNKTHYLGDANEEKRKAFKAGAEWKSKQGHTLEMVVKSDGGGYPYIDVIELYDYNKDEPLAEKGDKVIVQIRKK